MRDKYSYELLFWLRFQATNHNPKKNNNFSISEAPPICLHNFTEMSGNFSSDGYPVAYPLSYFCRWEFSAPEEHFIKATLYHVIQKKFLNFVGLVVLLFWTSCDTCPGFQNQSLRVPSEEMTDANPIFYSVKL